MIVSGVVVLGMVVTFVPRRAMIVSRVCIMTIIGVIVLSFESSFLKPVLPNVGGLGIDQCNS